MKTPEQIRNMEFQKSPMGGYKQSDVELFLEEMASEIEILMRQKAEADRRLKEYAAKSPDGALSTAGIQNVLISAQRVAEQITDEAKENAERIAAEAELKVTQAEIKAKDIIGDAENKARLLGDTAEKEAAKIIAAAVEKSEQTLAAAKESTELEQKLYDRLKIEMSDFRKKASAQCSSLIELINQLPSEIPFNIERAKTVLSIDFSDPETLLDKAVEERLLKEKAAAEARMQAEKAEAKAESAAAPAAPSAPVVPAAPAAPAAKAESVSVPVQAPQAAKPVMPTVQEIVSAPEMAEEPAASPKALENAAPAERAAKLDAFLNADKDKKEDEQPKKGRISFGISDDDDDEDDDDDDDEPRLFFKRKKK